MQFIVEFLAFQLEFEESEWIDDLFRDLPDDLHGPLGVDDVESEETALEVVLQRLCHRFNQLGGDFCDTDTLEIYDCYPVLYLAWD